MRVAVIIAVLAVAAPAAAQSFDAFANVSAGGSITTDDATPLVGVRGGAFLGPKLVVYGEGWTRICRDSRVLGVGARYWGRPKIWISYAAGVSRRAVAPEGTGCFPNEFKRSHGLWMGSRVGADLFRDKYFALEVSLRGDYERYFDGFKRFDDEEKSSFSLPSFGLELGISFY